MIVIDREGFAIKSLIVHSSLGIILGITTTYRSKTGKMLEILTFGGLSILKDGEVLRELGSRKAEALLVYLAVEGGQHPRKVLMTLLWPESPEELAATSLRVVLSTLRKTLKPYLEISRTSVGLNIEAGIKIDVIGLEDELATNHIDHALEIYQGDFLIGFHIRDSLEFEDWRLLVQERCRRLLVNALHICVSRKIQAGEIKAGLELAHHLLALDPLGEIAHQQYILLLALDGQRNAALLQYEQCCKILQSELGVQPSDGLKALFHQIASGEDLSAAIPMQPKHNLPAQQSTFIGRDSELIQIIRMIEDAHCRLIMLLGPGGIGKTRLALQAGVKSLNFFADGTYFVPLEPVPSPSTLFPAVADAISFDFDNIATTLDPKSQLLDFLKHRSIFLILDSFEHLNEAAGLLSVMLKHAPGLKLLVTSREQLGLQGEWILRLEGLPITEDMLALKTHDATALALFCERARQARADFQLTKTEHEHAVKICQLVEGMPLGVELAASWVSVLSCEEIAEEMQKSLDFLSASMLDLPLKHRSIRAVFDYSWRLLAEEQQETFRKLSVFLGGFDRSAAMQVVGANLNQLSLFIGKSLIRRNASGRFEMHRLLRQYATEKLDEMPEEKADAYDRHAHYYLDFLSYRENELMGSRMIRVREEIRKELGNVLTAVDWALRMWDTEAVLRALEGLFSFYAVQGWHEGRDAFDRFAHQTAQSALSENHLPPLQNPVYLSLRVHQTFFSSNLGITDESEAISKECLSALRESKMPIELSICLHNLGVNACFRGEYELSIQRLEEAISLGREKPTFAWRTYYLWLGYVYFMIGEYERGMESLLTCYELFDEIDSLWGKAFALSKMGLAADGLKEYNQAMRYHREALAIFETTGDQAGRAYALSRMSMGAYFLEEYEDALRFGQEGYKAFQEIGHRWGICASLGRLGFAYLGLGEIEKAKDEFYEALRLSKQNQMTPLILKALIGVACTLAREGEVERCVELYQFAHKHPKTPAIYLDMATRWFTNIDMRTLQKEVITTAEKDDGDVLEKIVDRILIRQGQI